MGQFLLLNGNLRILGYWGFVVAGSYYIINIFGLSGSTYEGTSLAHFYSR